MVAIRFNHGVVLAAISLVLVAGAVTAGFHKRQTKVTSGLEELICENPHHDFGLIPAETSGTLQHQFRLRNASKSAVQIVKASASCGCTVVQAPTDPIPPGGEVSIPVNVNWNSRVGHQDSTVMVVTEPPLTRPMILVLRGLIDTAAAITPRTINFGTLGPGEVVTRRVAVIGRENGEPFVITSVLNPSKNIEISRKADAGAALEGPPGDFEITVRAPRTGGDEKSTILFNTDAPRNSALRLFVVARFHPAILAEPALLTFAVPGSSASGKSATADLFIMSGDSRMNVEDARVEIVARLPDAKPPFRVLNSRLTERNGRPAKQMTLVFDGDAVSPGQDLFRADLVITRGPDRKEIPLIASVTRLSVLPPG